MRPKQLVISWTQKFVYSWLVFCVGGVGSLTYFDGFLPGHEHAHHPYHWSLFEQPGHTHNPLPPRPEVLAEQMRFWLVSRLNPQTDFVATQNLGPGFARFFASGLSDGYILTTLPPHIFDQPALSGSVSSAGLAGRSAALAPPEKPPRFI